MRYGTIGKMLASTKIEQLTYAQLQAECRKYREKGCKVPRLNSKKVVLIKWLIDSQTQGTSDTSEVSQTSKPVLLGKGGFGTVHKGVNEQGVAVAVKKYKEGSYQANSFVREYFFLRYLQSPRMVSVYGANSHTFEITLSLQKMSLYNLKAETCSPAELRQIALDIIEGISRMHVGGVVHGDIKPANILISEEKRALICDLGGARIKAGPGVYQKRGETTYKYAHPSYLFGEVSKCEQTDAWSLAWAFLAWCILPSLSLIPGAPVSDDKKQAVFDQYIAVLGLPVSAETITDTTLRKKLQRLYTSTSEAETSRKRAAVLDQFKKLGIYDVGKEMLKMLRWNILLQQTPAETLKQLIDKAFTQGAKLPKGPLAAAKKYTAIYRKVSGLPTQKASRICTKLFKSIYGSSNLTDADKRYVPDMVATIDLVTDSFRQ